MKVRSLLAGVALLPGAAFAAETMDYTYAELGYVSTEIDVGGVDVDGDGLGVRGSFEIVDGLTLLGQYATQDFDGGVDFTTLEAGAGWHMSINPNVDFVSHLVLINVEADSGIASIDEDGYGVGIGLRGHVNQAFEWEGGVDFNDVGDTSTAFRVDGRYHFTSMFSAGGGFTVDDDTTQFRVGMRAQFGGI